jgi:hypothetical protein
MIAKSLWIFILLIIIPDLYIDFRYLRKYRWWWQLLWFVPGLLLVAGAVVLALQRDFVPDNMLCVNLFLFFMGLLAIPKAVFSIASLCGKKGWKVGLALVPLLWFVLFYGSFVGNNRMEIRRVDLSFADLPASFDGYRIALFSDIHLGSMDKDFVQRAVDTLNALHADAIVFAGDIQNKQPSEIEPFQDMLSTLKARDGVFSVLGNHDYAEYIDLTPLEAYRNEGETVSREGDMKWSLLMNDHRTIRRSDDYIVIAGMENDGEGRFPQLGDINNTLWGVSTSQFVVMIEHDPSSWRRKILPHCHAQLTLSGHTHGMQFELFGYSPLALMGKEVDGLYKAGPRYLYVSKGLGGVVPFRFGATPEIVVITLHCK